MYASGDGIEQSNSKAREWWITIINKQKEENVIKVSTCQYISSCVRVKEQ